MAQQLEHMTKDQLVKAVCAELKNCYSNMTNGIVSRDYLCGKIQAYKTVLQMVGISDVSIVVLSDSDRR